MKNSSSICVMDGAGQHYPLNKVLNSTGNLGAEGGRGDKGGSKANDFNYPVSHSIKI